MIARATISALAVIALAGCTSAQEQRARQQQRAATEFLSRQGSIGDPGRVAAADLAFARMARDEGTWTAFRAYAAPGAFMDAPLADSVDGFDLVSALLAGQSDPPEPIRWEPTDVWSSCDGTLAVSQGRFLRPNGVVGDYVTVWELQSDNSYKYVYDTGTPDDPQPVPQPREELPEGAIVVPGLTALQGRIADCPRGDIPLPEIPRLARGAQYVRGEQSRDGTLRWSSNLYADGHRNVVVEWVRDGAVEQVVDMDIPAGG